MYSKSNSPRCELLIRDMKIKQVKKFNSLGNDLTNEEKCDTEIQTSIE